MPDRSDIADEVRIHPCGGVEHARAGRAESPGVVVVGHTKAFCGALSVVMPTLVRMTDAARGARKLASSYSTGGGGVVLEHRYGAVLLAHLLSRGPVPGLHSDEFAVERVAFQAAEHAVDDFEVTGRADNDVVVRWLVAVRRAPDLVPSNGKSMALIGSFLKVLDDEPEALRSGTRRLVLVVSSPQNHAGQLGELADLAADSDSNDAFRAKAGNKNKAVADRLGYIDQMVATATGGGEITAHTAELTWRLLAGLTVHQADLEGAQGLRSQTVEALRPVTATGTAGAANELFRRLEGLADTFAPTAGTITENLLRRRLIGFPLARSRSHQAGWQYLDRAESWLRERTGSRLTSDEVPAAVHLPRDRARDDLASAITTTATTATDTTAELAHVLVVTGEPDVGKSALTLDALDQLGQTGEVISAAVALDELPSTVGALETVLGGGIEEVLAGQAGGPPRVLVLDGAEAVQGGRGPLLGALALGAARARMGVVAVSREDARDAVTAALGAVGLRPHGHTVPRLGSEDVAELVTSFPSLSGLSQDPRRAWLLGRPGLVDLLLRARAIEELPAGPLCEADVLRVLWQGLVRHHDTLGPGGASPDGRAETLLALAEAQLDPATPVTPSAVAAEPAALASLRSDGVLAPVHPWDDQPRFASDLVRDLALARKLHSQGWDSLRSAGAPRWAVRAARLACQTRLVQTVATAREDPVHALQALQQQMDALAAEGGGRWTELPCEAVLALAGAHDILAALWPRWLTDDHVLATVLRLAMHNFPISDAAADPLVLAPLVELVVADPTPPITRRTRAAEQNSVPELLATWLRARNRAGPDAPDPLRARLRDRLLALGSGRGDALVLEMLATLGPDLDAATETALRDLADTQPEGLAPVVERPHATCSLARHQPGLLLFLAESYYLESPGQGYSGWHDEGVRDHELEGGFGPGWRRGPFLHLLEHVPAAAVGFIQRMLNTAAQRRGQQMAGHRGVLGETHRTGATLDLPRSGGQFCHGDDHVWYWHRPRSVGPHPCKSALLALERFIEQTLQNPSMTLGRLAAFLLEGCANLAMPGLVFDMLARHLERDETAIDQWLIQPEVWELEFARATGEVGTPMFGPDGPVTASARRSWTPRDVAMYLMGRAILRADQDRVDHIASLGPRLLSAATPPDREARAAVATWVAHLDPANYRGARDRNGALVLAYLPPAELADASSEQQAIFARSELQLRLWNTYSGDPDRAGPVENLIEDLEAARAMTVEPRWVLDVALDDGLAAIAATALRAHADDRAALPDDDLVWAADLLLARADIEAQSHRWRAPSDERGSARSTGIGLATLLHPRLAHLGIEPARRDAAIATCTSAGVDDLRDGLVTGLAPLWTITCGPDPTGTKTSGTDTCLHRTAWAVVEQLAEPVTSGEPTAARPVTDTLPAVPSEDVQPLLLTAPIVASADATGSVCNATAARARDGHAVLLDAHRRHAPWLRRDPGPVSQILAHHEQVTRVLLGHAAGGDPRPVREHVAGYLEHPEALGLLLTTALQTFTHDAELRGALTDLWPPLMDQVLDHVEQHRGDDSDPVARPEGDSPQQRAVPPTQLVPHPQARWFAPDKHRVVTGAAADWIPPDPVAAAVQRWIRASPPSTAAVEALVGLIATAEPAWQASTGLSWVTALINGRYQNASRSAVLIGWIHDIHKGGSSTDAAVLNPLVDGLIAHGASRLVELQRQGEQAHST